MKEDNHYSSADNPDPLDDGLTPTLPRPAAIAALVALLCAVAMMLI